MSDFKIDNAILPEIVDSSCNALINQNCPSGALDYIFKERGLNLKIAKLFGIGFCGLELERYLNRSYYECKVEDPPFPPDRLRDKIIIPIRDDFGKLKSIATRSIGKGQPWWNTPFAKGNVFFGLNQSRTEIFIKNKIYIVEGYFDFLLLFQKGIRNVCAIMGLRFNGIHAGLVKRYCKNICFCFDTDPSKNGKTGSGQKATLRVMKENKDIFNLSCIHLPLGIDPDEYVMQYGVESLLALESNIIKIGDS